MKHAIKTKTYNAWWRELGAISRGMMFIEGNITAPDNLDHTQQDVRASAAPHSSPPREAGLVKQRKEAFGLYEDLLFLGGRPMIAGHNDDIDDPFPQTHADEPPRFDGHRTETPQSQACAAC